MDTQITTQLMVVHRPKDAAGHGLSQLRARQLAKRGLCVDTCLRQVWILFGHNTPIDSDPDCTVYRGTEAYSFLLQTMTGLNSAIPGETNVLGQFKCAWKRWAKNAPPEQVLDTAQLMTSLLPGVKKIRQDFLQNIGGASYGSLVRKLINPQPDAHILFVGAGKFSMSMLPLFNNWKTALWNHRLHKGVEEEGLEIKDHTRAFLPDAASQAADWASHVILTTPPNEQHDAKWLGLATDRNIREIVHLGLRREEPSAWATRSHPFRFHSLDDVFDLRAQQSALRDLGLQRARQACIRAAMFSVPTAPDQAQAVSLRA